MFSLSGRVSEPYFSIFTLGSRQHKTRVWHIIPQIHVGTTAQDLSTFLKGDIGFYGNSIGTNHRSICSPLTLNFSTFRISEGNRQNETLMKSL